MKTKKILILGGGIFGITAAVELRRRGHDVHLFDQGQLPYPEASSTDISKMVRADYGGDAFYIRLMLEAIKGWERWNETWPRPLYHPTGFLMLTHEPMATGSLEMESLRELEQQGRKVERLQPDAIHERFPQWNADRYADGYYNPLGGWAESGAVVAQLVAEARRLGVNIHEEVGFKDFLESGRHVRGFFATDRNVYGGDLILLCTGAWTPTLLPEMAGMLQVNGQPIFMLKPKDASPFRGKSFPGWSSDISKTGWYGFPANADGLVKAAHHSRGFPVDPREGREFPAEVYPKFQEFLSDHLPALAKAPVVDTRLCLYCDSWDGDFYISHHPERPGLVVATGGSGHGFKFAPVLGGIIADVMEEKKNPYSHRFAWREKGQPRKEAARNWSPGQ